MSLTNRASLAVETLLEIRSNIPRLLAAYEDGTLSATGTNLSQDEMRLRLIDSLATTKDAVPFWWEPSIGGVVEAAAEQLPTWTVRPELFPAPSGFFLYSRPIGGFPAGVDNLAAVSWLVNDIGVLMVLYARHAGLLVEAESTWMPWGRDVDDMDEVIDPMASSDGLAKGLRRLRMVGASLLFLEQRVAISVVERPDRAALRRFERADIEYPELRVVRLRTPQATTRVDEEAVVDWQYRWIVRGHWRQQYYKSDGSHRPIWITPYVKGPDGKPLKTPKASVFAVVR